VAILLRPGYASKECFGLVVVLTVSFRVHGALPFYDKKVKRTERQTNSNGPAVQGCTQLGAGLHLSKVRGCTFRRCGAAPVRSLVGTDLYDGDPGVFSGLVKQD
jgi:hypothetical protein